MQETLGGALWLFLIALAWALPILVIIWVVITLTAMRRALEAIATHLRGIEATLKAQESVR